jgi:hypothetical protein
MPNLRERRRRYARVPRPAKTARPPAPNSRPSCSPAVSPPPVSGAVVGNAGDAAADECVGRMVVTPGVGSAVDELDARGELVDEAFDEEAEEEGACAVALPAPLE